MHLTDKPNIDIVHAELGHCLGVAAIRPSTENSYVHIMIIVEDDENWYSTTGPGFHSRWLPELADTTSRMVQWLDQNCSKTQWGWKFK